MVTVYLIRRAISTIICIFHIKSVRTLSALTEDGFFLITALAQGCCVWLDLTLFHVLDTQQTVNEAMLSVPHRGFGSLCPVRTFQARKGPAHTGRLRAGTDVFHDF